MVKIGNIQLPDFPLLLAPMEDVSDPPFRAVCKDKGADLMYTEFISSGRIDQGCHQKPEKTGHFRL
jgi:tRNA-dihydrouridine synthase